MSTEFVVQSHGQRSLPLVGM